MDNFEGGYHQRGHQPNGIVPRPQPQLPIVTEIPNLGMGNGTAGSSYNSNANVPTNAIQLPGQRDPQGPPREVTRTRSRDREPTKETSSSKGLPKMLKIAVVGDSTSGKTAICHAVTSEGYNFNKNYHLTCGVGIHSKSIKLPEPIDGQDDRINMILVDSSGKDIYTEYLPKYWDKLNGVVVVIDLTSKSALESASQWLDLAKGSIPQSSSGLLGVLIGNKIDLTERRRAISPKAAQDFATKNQLQYFECSVKENSGLEEPFFYLAHQWVVGLGSGGGLSRTSSYDKENIASQDVF